jgi:hypothetical protein
MIFRKISNLEQHPLEVRENPKLPGVYIVDGLIKHDLLREKYEWFLRKVAWRFIINSGNNSVVTYPSNRMADVMGDNKMWGFSLYDESCEPPYNIASIGVDFGDESDFDWLMELSSFITQQIFDCPFDLFGSHINGQTKLQNAQVHADTGFNLVVYLTPDWKQEWGGGLAVYENQFTEEPLDIIPYVSGRVIFYHGLKGHREGLKFTPQWINSSPIWHQGRAPTEECTELRISMNLRGKVMYRGAPINELEPRDKLTEDFRSIRENNKDLLEYEKE